MKQISIGKEKAIELSKSGYWKDMSFKERAIWQMTVKELAMPFNVFHEAVEKTLGRPVFTHEFGSRGSKGIWDELMGYKEAPTMDEIINMIPEEKRIILV